MFDPTLSTCQKCLTGIAYMKYRISEDELKRVCKKVCGRHKTNPKDDEPDLFTVFSGLTMTNCNEITK